MPSRTYGQIRFFAVRRLGGNVVKAGSILSSPDIDGNAYNSLPVGRVFSTAALRSGACTDRITSSVQYHIIYSKRAEYARDSSGKQRGDMVSCLLKSNENSR